MLLILTTAYLGSTSATLGPWDQYDSRGPGNLPASRGSATVDDIKPALP